MAVMQWDDNERAVDLGHPIDGGPLPSWGMTVIWRYNPETNKPEFMPLAFSPDQAREMARRIISHYGPAVLARTKGDHVKTLKDMTDEELDELDEISWTALRDAMLKWQDICREQARRDSLRRRLREATERGAT